MSNDAPIGRQELYDAGQMLVACGECGHELWISNLYALAGPPGPIGDMDSWVRFASSDTGDPDDGLHECPECHVQLETRDDVRRIAVKLSEGDRIRATHFWIDAGLRIWPDPHQASGKVYVVQVEDDGRTWSLVEHGPQREMEAKYPDARWSVNDNETVPPGTEGTVTIVTSLSVGVQWDNGSSIGVTERDTYETL